MMRSEAPLANDEVNSVLQSGMMAEVAPSRVIRPRISVIKDVAALVIRAPTAIPIEDPTRTATTLITVPRPINIR
jgi:hypothetical protein